MASFPTLSSGTTVFEPLTRAHRRPVTVVRFSSGAEQRWIAGTQLSSLKMSFAGVSLADRNAVAQFFRDCKGRFDTTWDIHIAGETISHLTFDSDEFRSTESAPGAYDFSLAARQVIV
jgi:hypothetical protein